MTTKKLKNTQNRNKILSLSFFKDYNLKYSLIFTIVHYIQNFVILNILFNHLVIKKHN